MNLDLYDLDTAAKTVWGEARGEGTLGMLAVAHVIVNRWRKASSGLALVCKRPMQFSCWNENDPNLSKMDLVGPNDTNYRIALGCVLDAVDGAQDPTEGSTHYHVDSITPKWAIGHMCAVQIGHHKFYNDVA